MLRREKETSSTVAMQPNEGTVYRYAAWPASIWLISISLMIGGCLPPEADFKWGLGTSEIVGTVETASSDTDMADVLVVVFQSHYLLKTMDTEERIYRVSARLGYVDDFGRYVVHMPSDVVTLELMFIAPDHLTDQFRFNRQIGIGQVSYRAHLREHSDWRSHFYTFLQPILSDLIVEQRYRLSREDQLRLGNWLQAQQARLEVKMKHEQESALPLHTWVKPATRER